MPTFRLFVLSLVIALAATLGAADAAELKGRVTALIGDDLEIRLATRAKPNIGDKVEISFDAGGLTVAVGTWKVSRITADGSIVARRVAASAAANIDMIAVIHSTVGARPKLVSPGRTGASKLVRERDPEPRHRLPPLRPLQIDLAGLGYDPGPIDGRMGFKTRDAIRRFQRDHGLRVDGQLTMALGAAIRAAGTNRRRGPNADKIYTDAVGFFHGRDGKSKNRKRARGLFEKAARSGHIRAMADFAGMLYRGQGGPKNRKDAFSWYLAAANKNHAGAQLSVGFLYENGIVVRRSFPSAEKWYLKAARKGDKWAALRYANLVVQALPGRKRNHKAAEKWYRVAAEKGIAQAQANLGLMYWHDEGGIRKDYARALKWLRMAEKQGYPLAISRIGYMYENGWGVSKDEDTAVSYYRRALAKNDSFAEARLRILGYKR